MKLRQFILSLLTGLVILGVCSLIGSLFLDPGYLLELLQKKLLGKAGASRFQEIVTPAKLRLIQVFIGATLVSLLFVLWEMRSPRNRILGFFLEIRKQVSLTLGIFREPVYVLVLLLPFASAIFYSITLPVSYDEAITYISFTSKNILVSYTYYPFPNNHVLHTIVTSLTKYLPFSTLFNLRISSVFFQMSAWAMAIRLTKEQFGKKTTLPIVGLSAMLFLNMYYSYMSRGYALVNFSFIGSLYCVIKILNNSKNPWKWHFLTLFSTIGFCTMPSFLYPFLSLHIVLLVRQRRITLPQLLSGLFTVLATALFYTPIIIVNGLDALINNPYVTPVSRQEVLQSLPLFVRQSITEISGFHWMIVTPILIIGAIHFFAFGQKERRVEFLIWVFSIPAFLILHSVIPFPRTFIYYGFLLSFLTLASFQKILEKTPLSLLALICLLLQISLWVNFHSRIEAYEERDPQINITASRIIPHIIGENNTYLSSGALLATNLLFETKARKIKDPQISFTDKPVNADTSLSYDYIIVVRYRDSTRLRSPRFSNFYYNVYERQRP